MRMLNEVNPYVKKFRSARDRFNKDPEDSFHTRIVSERLKAEGHITHPLPQRLPPLFLEILVLIWTEGILFYNKNQGNC